MDVFLWITSERQTGGFFHRNQHFSFSEEGGAKMAVFRIEKTRDYTVMSNYHLRDMSLSLKAKGLLSLMLSLPENWDYTMKGLAHICKDGIDSISGGIRELEAHGYLIRARVRGANGQLGSIEYTILEQPKAPSPTQEKPIRENPVQVNPMSLPGTLMRHLQQVPIWTCNYLPRKKCSLLLIWQFSKVSY